MWGVLLEPGPGLVWFGVGLDSAFAAMLAVVSGYSSRQGLVARQSCDWNESAG